MPPRRSSRTRDVELQPTGDDATLLTFHQDEPRTTKAAGAKRRARARTPPPPTRQQLSDYASSDSDSDDGDDDDDTLKLASRTAQQKQMTVSFAEPIETRESLAVQQETVRNAARGVHEKLRRGEIPFYDAAQDDTERTVVIDRPTFTALHQDSGFEFEDANRPPWVPSLPQPMLDRIRSWQVIETLTELDQRSKPWYTMVLLVAGFLKTDVDQLVVPAPSTASGSAARPTRASVRGTLFDDGGGGASQVGLTGAIGTVPLASAVTPYGGAGDYFDEFAVADGETFVSPGGFADAAGAELDAEEAKRAKAAKVAAARAAKEAKAAAAKAAKEAREVAAKAAQEAAEAAKVAADAAQVVLEAAIAEEAREREALFDPAPLAALVEETPVPVPVAAAAAAAAPVPAGTLSVAERQRRAAERRQEKMQQFSAGRFAQFRDDRRNTEWFDVSNQPLAAKRRRELRVAGAQAQAWITRPVATGIYYLNNNYVAARDEAHMLITARADQLGTVPLRAFIAEDAHDAVQTRIRTQFARLIATLYNFHRYNTNRFVKLAHDGANYQAQCEDILCYFVNRITYDAQSERFNDTGARGAVNAQPPWVRRPLTVFSATAARFDPLLSSSLSSRAPLSRAAASMLVVGAPRATFR